jgi:Ubiquitin-activating enzyme E1 FCCH domain
MEPLRIGPYQVGVQQDLKPFMIPDEAFPDMLNAYVFRGRVTKKSGYTLLGRLRRALTTASSGNITAGGAGTFTFNLFTGLGLLSTEPNAQVEIGSITTISIVVNAAQTLTDSTGTGVFVVTGAGPITAASINYATGVLTVTFSGAGGGASTFTGAYYPGLPVMGIRYYDDPSVINTPKTIFFDTKYAYTFTTQFTELVPGTTWSGSDKEQFWTTNYQNTAADAPIIWVTNGNVADNIKYYDGSTWTNFTPDITSALSVSQTLLYGCLMIVPYKNRLVVLSTFEGLSSGGSSGAVAFTQRARWSTITVDATIQATSWLDETGKGGSVDASTDEDIISCGFIKDELIVYFERSTWKLVYTGNDVFPFVWQRINSELGADATFSPIQFDNGLLCFGNVGIHTCNGAQVKRIDEKIPDEVFNIHNGTDGPQRVSGVRDFFQEIVYYAYPSDIRNTSSGGKIFFPNKMIIYNYRNNTFSFTNDNATTFGYFQNANSTPWSGLTHFTWAGWNAAWNSGVIQSSFPSVAFGNQQGFVETIIPFIGSTDSSLMLTNIVGNSITSPQHNLFDGQYVRIRNAIGVTGVNDTTVEIDVIDENTFTIDGPGAVGTYVGNGVMTVISDIDITTKQFTPYWDKGKNYNLKYFDVLVDRTFSGEIQVDIYINFDTAISMTSVSNTSVLGSPTLSTAPEATTTPYYQFQQNQEQIWKRFYANVVGETFQIQFSFSDAGMRNPNIYNEDVQIHAIIMYFAPGGEFY